MDQCSSNWWLISLRGRHIQSMLFREIGATWMPGQLHAQMRPLACLRSWSAAAVHALEQLHCVAAGCAKSLFCVHSYWIYLEFYKHPVIAKRDFSHTRPANPKRQVFLCCEARPPLPKGPAYNTAKLSGCTVQPVVRCRLLALGNRKSLPCRRPAERGASGQVVVREQMGRHRV